MNNLGKCHEMINIFPPAKATSQYGFGSTLSKEVLLRPEFGCVFNVSSIIDSSGSDNLAIMFKARGTLVDPSTNTPFS